MQISNGLFQYDVWSHEKDYGVYRRFSGHIQW